jgi:hypothetical protein
MPPKRQHPTHSSQSVESIEQPEIEGQKHYRGGRDEGKIPYCGC